MLQHIYHTSGKVKEEKQMRLQVRNRLRILRDQRELIDRKNRWTNNDWLYSQRDRYVRHFVNGTLNCCRNRVPCCFLSGFKAVSVLITFISFD